MNRCLFCGGDAASPEHFKYCDGRQGRIEAQLLDARAHAGDGDSALREAAPALDDAVPLLISGLESDTWNTSAAAAISVEESKASQRAEVFAAIRAAGSEGATDDELQERLHLDGSSERPRRWELWKLNRIAMRRDDRGEVVKRLTRTHRRAVVWVAA